MKLANGQWHGGGTMPVTESYDSAGINIKVDPDSIFNSATLIIPDLGQYISDSVNRVVQIWNDLKLGWVGDTAQEAQDFNDRWSESIRELFGTGADSTSGILSQIAGGIAMASVNYGQAEDVVTTMFTQTADALGSGGGSGDPVSDGSKSDVPVTKTDDGSFGHRSVNGGPITENS
jgi:hypothetical protein